MDPVAADCNLLFGLLALQNGLIDQGQLVAAFQAWSLDKGRMLADFLVSRGDLTSAQRAAIETLAALHIEKYRGNAEKSLAAIPAGRSTLDCLARIADPDLGATLDRVGSSSPLHRDDGDTETDRTPTYSVGTATSDGQRFRILRPHARGGLGAVFVAMDTELHREVALKQILDRHADDPVSRQRFLIEAEVTGGLEHPGIVPVYGLGTYGDGRPYYAMRFIRGSSLKEAIEQFHADPGLKKNSGRRSLELRKLLQRFLDVCNAIEYAHSRGVLHRDIKPGNIIVGKHGETLVVDWGLAKAQGQDGVMQAIDERPLLPSSASGSSETLPGSALGTPGYMSAEQARGDLEHLGPRSDVYSLGATLFCLLTGKPPLEGDDIGELLRKTQQGEFPPPRQHDASISAALEAVCLKATARKPEDRYATPRLLADDIERWMADEPVMAFPEHRLARLARWLRRHRTWTYSPFAGSVAVCLVATVALIVVDGARRKESAASQEAQANFVTAQRAVDDYLTNVSEQTLLQAQESLDIRNLRRQLLQNALKYYQRFVTQRRKDPRLRTELANAFFRVGEITREIGSPHEAIEALGSAQEIWEQLGAAEPQDDKIKDHLAACHLKIGRLQEGLGNLREALKSLAQAQAILEPLVTRHQAEAAYEFRLADCLSGMGIVHALRDSTEPALERLNHARSILERLVARAPHEINFRKSLAEVINNLGFVHYKRHDYKAALKSYQEVRDIGETLLKGITVGPKPAWLLDRLAKTDYNTATIQLRNGDLQQSLRFFEQSLAYRSELVQAHPSVTEYHENLGESYREIADRLLVAHQDEKALAYAQKSLDIFQTLVQIHPDEARYHSELGRSWNLLGYGYDEARKNAQAIHPFEQAVAEQERAINLAKDLGDYKVYLSVHLENLGEQYIDLGRVEVGLPYYMRAIQLRRDLHTAHPGSQEYALQLADALLTFGTIQGHAGDTAAAIGLLSDAHKLLDRLSTEEPGDPVIAGRLAMALSRAAVAMATVQNPAGAIPLLERAVDSLSPLATRTSSDFQKRELLSETLWHLARIHRSLKRQADAAQIDAQQVNLWKGQPPAGLANLALKEVTRATLIGYGRTAIPAPAQAIRVLDLDLAASHLRFALSNGFTDLAALKVHPDFDILLTHDDLKSLVKGLGFPDHRLQAEPRTQKK
jgi:serine/threonine-protein kinase